MRCCRRSTEEHYRPVLCLPTQLIQKPILSMCPVGELWPLNQRYTIKIGFKSNFLNELLTESSLITTYSRFLLPYLKMDSKISPFSLLTIVRALATRCSSVLTRSKNSTSFQTRLGAPLYSPSGVHSQARLRL